MNYTLHHGDCLDILRTLPDNGVDAIVTDPPYGLSFMGKRWDYDVPSEDTWRECLRVLKPGGHLLAFAGTRTQHRMAVRIEDAGFEIRDMIAWVYGSGFPKSMDVSKAIDKMDAAEEQQARRYRFTAWVRSQGVTSKQIDDATATNMGGHYTTSASQPAIMTREHLEQCRHLFQDIPAWVETECDKRSVESRNFAEREVVGETRKGAQSQSTGKYGAWGDGITPTAPTTPAARQWHGWGTALKPALEPITVARKPLIGTVAENVLTWGTGGVNVDGCRVEASDGRPLIESKSEESLHAFGNGLNGSRCAGTTTLGRWPANLIHDGSEEVVGLFPETNSGGPAKKPSGYYESPEKGGANCYGVYGKSRIVAHQDSGSAARFFYCAKASKRDRDEGCDGMPLAGGHLASDQGGGGGWKADAKDNPNLPRHNAHPTVKPTDLMRYLCRLVTPPEGTVLDPFMGSGSTGKAAMLEGFQFIGIEREAEYLDIARARIEHAINNKPNRLL